MRHPEIGDKMASRHGQKGTIAQILDSHDLPYCSDGTVPDLIFNSHGIPSRMTIGQMWEQLLAKLRAVSEDTSKIFGGRAFSQSPVDLHSIFSRLHILGYHPYGREKMYSGSTGMPLDGTVSIGIVYYQRFPPTPTFVLYVLCMYPAICLPTHARHPGGAKGRVV